MTNKEQFLAALQYSLPLECGATVTFRVWGVNFIEQNAADFFAFLRLFVQGIRGQELEKQPATLGLLSRVARASLVNPDDADLITVPDLYPVAKAIFERNKLAAAAGGIIGLLMEGQQAVAAASESPNPSDSPS